MQFLVDLHGGFGKGKCYGNQELQTKKTTFSPAVLKGLNAQVLKRTSFMLGLFDENNGGLSLWVILEHTPQ